MAKFLQYRDGGKSDEKGMSTHLYGLFQGEVINGLAVTQDSPLGMSVLVSKGRCMIDSADDYPYLGFTDANEVVTITAADGSNPRIDAIVAYVDLSVVDSTSANNPGAFEIVAVAGTPAGSPNPPNDGAVSTAIGMGNPFIRLAHVTVGAGVTTITTGNVSDQRVSVGLPDGSVTTTKIADGAVTGAKIDFAATGAGGIWWEEIGRTTLASAGDTISVTGLPARKYLSIRFYGIASGQIGAIMRFNNDSTSGNYTSRSSTNGAADVTTDSATSILLSDAQTQNNFSTIDVINVSSRQKLIIATTNRTATGAIAPGRIEIAGNWVNTASSISRIDIVNTGTGDFAAGSEVVVLGHN